MHWDTNFFGVTCAKLILNGNFNLNEWDAIEEELHNYEFVVIENRNSNIVNSQILGVKTTAFLADTNIQFEKKVVLEPFEYSQFGIEIYNNVPVEEEIIEIANFDFSRFKTDKRLSDLGGNKLYKEWVKNSFNKKDKFFAISRGQLGEIRGFVLFSYSNMKCTVELIAVSNNHVSQGIGSMLFKAVEASSVQKGVEIIRVGTQASNRNAINFYHKAGCKQVECHQIYHYWTNSK